MDKETELSLIKGSLNGIPSAFRVLVEEYQGFAYQLASRYVHDEDEAEDITQEAFVRIWKNLAKYNSEFRFSTWLGKIVTNLSIDHLKSGRRRHERKVPESSMEMADSSSAHDNIEVEELKLMIMKLADGLSGKQRAAFVLRDLEMFSVEEVCRMLDVSEANLKSNLYHARMKIKEGLRVTYRSELNTDSQ